MMGKVTYFCDLNLQRVTIDHVLCDNKTERTMASYDYDSYDNGFICSDLDLNIPYLSNPEYEKVINLMNSAVTMEFDVWGIELPETVNSGDTLLVPLTVESITAHNIPSGTSFNRDVWVELKVSFDNEIIYS